MAVAGLCLALQLAAVGSQPARAQAAEPVPEWSEAARRRLLLGPSDQAGATLAERQRLLGEAEALLVTGQPLQARERLERAAMLLHAPDTESALVRADLQAGQYRRALAFAAHAAGAHKRDWPAGMAMYAWLLRIGGQERVADHLLAEALERTPGVPELQDAQRSLASPWPQAGPALDSLHLHPYALGTAVPPEARTTGAAVLLPDGAAALTAAGLLEGARTIWLRDGTGRTVAAERDGPADALGVQRLRLLTALPPPPVQTAARPPFAGSPGYVLDHAPGGHQPAWPLLRQGFFGNMPRAGDEVAGRPLGFDLPPGPRGGPVFDADGRLAGLAVTGADGMARLLPASRYLTAGSAAGTGVADGEPAVKRPRPAADEVYEQALRQTLQLLVLR